MLFLCLDHNLFRRKGSEKRTEAQFYRVITVVGDIGPAVAVMVATTRGPLLDTELRSARQSGVSMQVRRKHNTTQK